MNRTKPNTTSQELYQGLETSKSILEKLLSIKPLKLQKLGLKELKKSIRKMKNLFDRKG